MALTLINSVIENFFQCMDQFFPFEDKPEIAVATSGGPDSLALCLLLNHWVTQKQGKLISLTVDHRLRAGSTQEAEQVNQWLTAQEIEHHILPWIGQKPSHDIQNKARNIRYQLLEEWCEVHHILHLFLGHHCGDQEETILQRLLHASGPQGLQGMQACTYRPFGRLLRPLLKMSKQQLIYFLDATHQSYFSDPSNLNLSFERVKIRALLPQLEGLTNTSYPFTQLASKCHDFTEIAQEALTQFLLKSVSLNLLGYLQVTKDAFLTLSPALQTLVLSHCLQAVGGSPYPFSGKQLRLILEKISQHKNTTMGGCFIVHKSSEIWIVREGRAIAKKTDVYQNCIYWDNRFVIQVPDSLKGSQIIPYAQLPSDFKTEKNLDKLPQYILDSLPFIQKSRGQTISVLTAGQGIFWRLLFKNKLT